MALTIILFITNIATLSATIFFVTERKGLINNLSEKKQRLKEAEDNLKTVSNEKNDLSNYKGRFEQLENDSRQIFKENKDLKAQNDTLLSEKNEIETQKKLLKEKHNALSKEKEEWGKDKENLLNKLSLKLIEKNSEINTQNSKENREKVKIIVEELLQNFENVKEKVSSLDDRDKKREKDFHEIARGLLYPSGAGSSAEITLANILKASGLSQKKNKEDDGDYILQTSFNTKSDEDPTKRPDAIIYMPNNHYVIIDSKASSHFIELQNAVDNKDKEKEKELRRKLKDSMEKHLKDLKNRDYGKTQLEALKNEEIKTPPSVTTLMFLQTEKMLDTIRDIDKNFETKCFNEGIPVITPVGLANLLSQGKLSIYKERQAKNINFLKEEVRKLLDNIVSLFTNSDKLGHNLKRTLLNYNDFSKVMNKILNKFGNIKKLGIETKKEIPHKLEQYELATTTIEGEIKELQEEENKLIEN